MVGTPHISSKIPRVQKPNPPSESVDTSTKTLSNSINKDSPHAELESTMLNTGSLISTGMSDESSMLIEKATEAEIKELIDILIESGK
jgi:hypothetical protein